MNKAEALAIFARALMRELIADEKPAPKAAVTPRKTRAPKPPPDDPDPNPQPRFDFDESNDSCLHGDLWIPKAACPIHGPSAQNGVTDTELDAIAGGELPAPLARAKRLAEQRLAQEREGRLFPEELGNMKGMGPPPE